jgi:small subunit ribosomal protein S3
MGQKVHPYSIRLPFLRYWKSNWFASRHNEYEQNVQEDIKLRKFVQRKLTDAGVASVDILRNNQSITVIIRTSKPGIVIGKSGSNIELLREQLRKMMNKLIDVKIFEVRKPDLNATLVAQNIGNQIERRVAYRRAVKMTIEKVKEAGALGVKVAIGGRLNGSEIARRESYKDGNIPLHTLRADIDYAIYHAQTSYGVIGVKVWIFRGLVFDRSQVPENMEQEVKGGSTGKRVDMNNQPNEPTAV